MCTATSEINVNTRSDAQAKLCFHIFKKVAQGESVLQFADFGGICKQNIKKMQYTKNKETGVSVDPCLN